MVAPVVAVELSLVYKMRCILYLRRRRGPPLYRTIGRGPPFVVDSPFCHTRRSGPPRPPRTSLSPLRLPWTSLSPYVPTCTSPTAMYMYFAAAHCLTNCHGLRRCRWRRRGPLRPSSTSPTSYKATWTSPLPYETLWIFP